MNKRISIVLIVVFTLNFIIMSPVGAGTLSISAPDRIEAPSEITVAVGESVSLTATLYFSDGKTIDAARNGVYSFGKVISYNNGIITGKKVGNTTLKIKSYGKTANIKIKVINTGKEIVKIEAPNNLNVGVGGTAIFASTAIFSDGSSADITGDAQTISSNSKVASVSNGIITGIKPGISTIRITYEGKTANIKVKVTKTGKEIVSIEVPKNLIVGVGENVTVTAIAHFSDGSISDITEDAKMTVSNPKIAAVNNKGIVKGIKAGNTVVKVSYDGKTASITIKVTKTGKEIVSIEVPQNIDVTQDESTTFKATANYSDGSSADITNDAVITVANPKIAYTNSGTITGIKAGSTTIKVVFDGKTAQIRVKVIKSTKEFVYLEVPRTVNVAVGESKPVTAVVHYSDYSSEDVTQKAVLTVAKTAIATYENGMITGKKIGTTLVTVATNGTIGTIVVNVRQSTLTGIEDDDTGQTGTGDTGNNGNTENTGNTANNEQTETPKIEPVRIETQKEITLAVGDQVPLTATVYYSDGTSEDAIKDALYLVDNKEIIAVTQGIITGKKAGTTSFKIKSHGITNTVQVEVTQKEEEQPNSTDQTIGPVTVSGAKVTKNFSWQCNGINYNWSVDVPQDLLDYNANIRNTMIKYYSCKTAKEQKTMLYYMSPEMKELVLCNDGDFTDWVSESRNLTYMGMLAERLQAQASQNGMNEYETANFVLKFVQSTPYVGGDWPQCAADSLVLTSDCDTKSILYCSILKNMGYKVGLIDYIYAKGPGHATAAVALNSSNVPQGLIGSPQTVNGLKYYEAECTSSQWSLGDSSGILQSKTGTLYLVK